MEAVLQTLKPDGNGVSVKQHAALIQRLSDADPNDPKEIKGSLVALGNFTMWRVNALEKTARRNTWSTRISMLFLLILAATGHQQLAPFFGLGG